MVMVTVEIRGAERVISRLKKAEQLEAELVKAVQDITLKQEKVAKQFAPVDTGFLRDRDITSEVIVSKDRIEGRVGPRNTAKNIVMEMGRKPGRMPPVEALIPWVKRHGMAGKVSGKGFKRTKSMVAVEDSARSIAFLIARKIARRGIKGHWYMRDAQRALATYSEARIRRAVEKCMGA